MPSLRSLINPNPNPNPGWRWKIITKESADTAKERVLIRRELLDMNRKRAFIQVRQIRAIMRMDRLIRGWLEWLYVCKHSKDHHTIARLPPEARHNPKSNPNPKPDAYACLRRETQSCGGTPSPRGSLQPGTSAHSVMSYASRLRSS